MYLMQVAYVKNGLTCIYTSTIRCKMLLKELEPRLWLENNEKTRPAGKDRRNLSEIVGGIDMCIMD